MMPQYLPGPPVSSAQTPSVGLMTPPIRPNATAVPTPVPRIDVGYTWAASAYIVVCTALMSPPVHASMTKTRTLACGEMDMTDITTAPATAPAAIVSIEMREPTRM